jgi:hypothetical protein
MRGTDVHQSGMFSYVSLESRVPQGHPLRGIKELLDEALGGMSRDFDRGVCPGRTTLSLSSYCAQLSSWASPMRSPSGPRM